MDYLGEILYFISVSDLILCHKNEFTLAQNGIAWDILVFTFPLSDLEDVPPEETKYSKHL